MANRDSGAGGGGEAARRESPPEPPLAEQARTLVHRARTGALATCSREHPGFPFGSLAPFGIDARGRPTFLLSRMAVHTRNLVADARASLLVADPEGAAEGMAAGRVSLLGTVLPVPTEDVAAVREDYLARHPDAAAWVEFGDFGFQRLEPSALYLVAGFARMGWIAAEDYAAAAPDPLADVAAGILEHMNADHADALVLYCRAHAGIEAESAAMRAIDRLGFAVEARCGGERRSLRIGFPREVRTTADARAVLVEMVRQARGGGVTPQRGEASAAKARR